MKRFAVAIAAILPIMAGCTTSLKSYEDTIPTSGLRGGVPYRLPLLQYKITASYTLIDCNLDAENLVPIDIEAAAEPLTIEGESRVISYEGLSSSFKTSNLTIDYYEDTALLKSINAQVTDHGPEVAADILKSAVAVAKMVALPGGGGGPGPSLHEETGRPKMRCLDGVRELVAALKAARKGVKDFPDEAREVSDRLAVYAVKAQLGILTAAEKKKANADLDTAAALEKRLADLKESIEKLEKRLTFTAEWRFPTAASDRNTQLVPPNEAAKKWLGSLVTGSDIDVARETLRLKLAAALTPSLPPQPCGSKDGCRGVPSNDGVVYRTPAPGFFKICQSLAENCAADPKPLLAAQVQVPQFGALHILRLHNGWGEDNELNATFSRAGALTSFTYAAKSAPAQKAAAFMASATEQGVDLVNAIHEKKKTDAAEEATKKAADEKAEIDALQHRIDLLTKQNEFAAMESAQGDPNLAARNKQISDLTAEVGLLRLQKERKELLDAIGQAQ